MFLPPPGHVGNKTYRRLYLIAAAPVFFLTYAVVYAWRGVKECASEWVYAWQEPSF